MVCFLLSVGEGQNLSVKQSGRQEGVIYGPCRPVNVFWGGGGKSVYQKGPEQISQLVFSLFPTMVTLVWGAGGPPRWVFDYSKDALGAGGGGSSTNSNLHLLTPDPHLLEFH